MKQNRLFLWCLVVGLFVTTWAIGEEPAQKPETSAEKQPAVRPVDIMAELHLIRQVLDANYTGPFDSLDYPAKTPYKWAEWEDIYFRQDEYRSRLEDLVSENWSIGPWWWMVEVKVNCPDGLKRGGPIQFIVDYPLVENRQDLVYQAIRGDDGRTFVTIKEGKYHTPRFGYLSATAMMVVAIVLFLAVVLLVVYLITAAIKLLVDVLVEWLMDGKSDPAMELWAKRFVYCIVGAAIFIVPSVSWMIWSIVGRYW